MAGHVDALYFFLVAITAFFTTIIALAILYFAIRYRKQRNPQATQVHGSTALELFWTGVPLAIVMANRLPHHFSHDVIAQIRRQIADPDPALPTVCIPRQWLAVNAA